MPEDRAIAIEGLARRFRADFDFAYLARCWLDYLSDHLVWISEHDSVTNDPRPWNRKTTHDSSDSSALLHEALKSHLTPPAHDWFLGVPTWSWLASPLQAVFLDHGLPDGTRENTMPQTLSCSVIKAEFSEVSALEADTGSQRCLSVRGHVIRTTLAKFVRETFAWLSTEYAVSRACMPTWTLSVCWANDVSKSRVRSPIHGTEEPAENIWTQMPTVLPP